MHGCKKIHVDRPTGHVADASSALERLMVIKLNGHKVKVCLSFTWLTFLFNQHIYSTHALSFLSTLSTWACILLSLLYVYTFSWLYKQNRLLFKHKNPINKRLSKLTQSSLIYIMNRDLLWAASRSAINILTIMYSTASSLR